MAYIPNGALSAIVRFLLASRYAFRVFAHVGYIGGGPGDLIRGRERRRQWDHDRRPAAKSDDEDWTYKDHEEESEYAQARIRQQCAQFPCAVDAFNKALEGVDLTTNPVDSKPREVWAGSGGTRWINPVGDVVTPPPSSGSSAHPQQTYS